MFRTLVRAGREWNNDNASFLGAALAYYSLFSIAPLILIAVAVAGVVLGPAAAEGKVFEFLRDFVGDKSAEAVQKMVLASSRPSAASVSSIIATCVLVYAALSLFRQLKTALNIVWKFPPTPRHGVVAFL
jgi:membrane protein